MTMPYRFPQETQETTGSGPDFPGSSGDREKGKFRPSSIPRRTVVAVTGDDGNPIARTSDQIAVETLLWQKALVQALAWMSEGEEFTVSQVLDEVSKL